MNRIAHRLLTLAGHPSAEVYQLTVEV